MTSLSIPTTRTFSPADVRALLGVSNETLKLWRATGRLHALRVSYRVVAYTTPALLEFIARPGNEIYRKRVESALTMEEEIA